MNPLTQFKKIPILPLLIVLALVALASPASATLPPAEHRRAVEQDRRGHSRRGSGAFQSGGLNLHVRHLGCRV